MQTVVEFILDCGKRRDGGVEVEGKINARGLEQAILTIREGTRPTN
jgi:hypothetical protein